MNKNKTASTSSCSSIPLVTCFVDIFSLVIKSGSLNAAKTVSQEKKKDSGIETNVMDLKHFRLIICRSLNLIHYFFLTNLAREVASTGHVVHPYLRIYGKEVCYRALESLGKKYKTEDVGSKKFMASQCMDFEIVDSRSMVSQVQEFQVLLQETRAEGLTISESLQVATAESLQVATAIHKLPPQWKAFKSYLMHKRKEMSFENLIIKLRIEEDNKLVERKSGNSYSKKANVLKYDQNSGTKKCQSFKAKQGNETRKIKSRLQNVAKLEM